MTGIRALSPAGLVGIASLVIMSTVPAAAGGESGDTLMAPPLSSPARLCRTAAGRVSQK